LQFGVICLEGHIILSLKILPQISGICSLLFLFQNLERRFHRNI